jgi:uncharacterized protein YfaS (alpha-2-macroglobulin family)
MGRVLATLLGLSLLLALSGCGASHGQETSMSKAVALTDGPEPGDDPLELENFPATLRDGQPPEQAYQRPPLADAKPLSEAATAALLARLDALESEESDRQAFALRPGSQPAPRTGATVAGEFPPAGERERPQSPPPQGPFEVLRYGPEGEVDIAGQINISFDRPMIALSSHDDSIAAAVPLRLQPEVAGQWRWAGTRTLIFEPAAARLPMATSFSVSLDPATRAADGSGPAAALRWEFVTPPPRLLQSHPGGRGVSREPLIVLGFDQRVDGKKLLSHLQLKAAGKTLPGLRLASPKEIEASSSLPPQLRAIDPERIVALRTESRLPAASAIEIVLGAGAPSAEGPRTTTAEQRFGFHTYGPFKVVEQRCGWQGCGPSDDFTLRLSNPLAAEQDLDALVRIEPAVAGLTIHGHGSNLSISGLKPGQRSYSVQLGADLTDIHGQTIEGERKFRFDVGASPALLLAPSDGLITVDPYGPPRLVFHSVNLASYKLRVHRVDVADWPVWLRSAETQWNDGKPVPRQLPGTLVLQETRQIQAKIEEMAATTLDLRPWLKGENGHLLIEIEPAKPMADAQLPEQPRSAAMWLQVTRLGLDAVVDGSDLRGWVTDLRDGKPLAGAEVRLLPGSASARSDAAGLATLPLPVSQQESSWLEAHLGSDTAFLPENRHYRSWGDWQRRKRGEELRWHVIDDRGLYRPGEQVHLKGWLRLVELRPDGGLRLPEKAFGIKYKVLDSRGNTLTEGESSVAGLGGFDLAFDLPDNPNLGQATVQLELTGPAGMSTGRHVHSFQIQEFRTPEFQVSSSFGPAPVYAGDTLDARVTAAYYAGGALPGAPVSWQLSASSANYTPPGRSDWSFGLQSFWWLPDRAFGRSVSAQFAGQTDAGGHHDLAIVLDQYDLPRPLTISASVSVQDVNRQAWTSSSSTLVHPGQAYVGMKTDAYFVDRGKPLPLQLIVVDIDGKPLPKHRISVSAGRVDWISRAGEYREILRDPQHCELRSDAAGLATCELATGEGGQYRITAVVEDAQGRRNASRILRWVSGGKSPPVENVEVEELQFVPDRDSYGPGDVARILVQAPFEDGFGLLTLGRHGVLEQRQFQFDGSSHTLEIPIRSEWLPNVELNVIAVGASPRDDDSASGDGKPGAAPRPAQAAGTLMLKLSTAERRLSVALEPAQSELAPGADTHVDLRVSDASGRPLADAELTLVVVDEAILSLGGYKLADPMDLFYQLREAGVRAYHLRPTLRLDNGADAAMDKGLELAVMADAAPMMRSMAPPPPPPAPMAVPQDGGGESGAIAIRSDFNPLAAFVPSLRTDVNGKAVAKFRLPDNLTRYRIMAVAVSGASHYGIGESSLTARLPLMLRPSPPRFLNFGDRFEFPVVLQNQTDAPLAVQLALQASNLEHSGARGYGVTVPPHDRVEVRFPMAAEEAGRARYQLAAATGDFADAARGSLPVWTPATSEAFASYGVIDSGALEQPIALPGAVWPQFGGLSVTTTSTALQSLTDAFLYLHEYPFECSEQLASRVIATVALRDLLQAFEVADLASPEAIGKRVLGDLKLLESRQNGDGGFALWRQGQESWPYVSLHAAHALIRARDKGYKGSAQVLQRALAHLRQIEKHIPSDYGERVRQHIIAYSLHVRALDGDRDPTRARALIGEAGGLDKLSFESLGWLLGVLSGDPESATETAQIRRFLANRTSETAAGASFATSYSDGDHLIMHSDRRADAVILEAMIADQPDSDLIPKLVNSLQAHRVRGRWGNTQENVFVLLALDRYFQRFESVTPDFVARTWLGPDFAGEHAFRGRSTERHRIDIPMAWLAEQSPLGPLLLAKEGPGRLYYRIGMDYAPRSLKLAAARHGFEVDRRDGAGDDPHDVRQLDDGSWQIRAGARVMVELTMVAPARRHHVALVDPLPAGLEPINPALNPQAVPPDRPLPMSSGSRPAGLWWGGPWFEHQNLRDERAEAFASLLPGGVYSYRYEARATTPGEFVVPPARAEEMYEPETFGRSATDRVVVR